MSGGETGWSLQLPECLTGFRLFLGDRPGDAPASALDASDTAEPLLDASLEAVPEPQDMDRGEGSGGAQHESAAGAATECSLVNRMRQVWDGQIACLSTSSDEEDTQSNLCEPVTIDQRVEREVADRAASLRHHAASPRPATGPHGIPPSSGGQHERQLASEAATTTARVRQLESDARAANQAGGTGPVVELAVDLARVRMDLDAVTRKRHAIRRHIIAASGSTSGGLSIAGAAQYHSAFESIRPQGMHLLHTGEYLCGIHKMDLEQRVSDANARAAHYLANSENCGFDPLVHVRQPLDGSSPGIDTSLSDKRLMRLFKLLHDASPKYREQIAAIEEHHSRPVLVQEMPMPVEVFEFPACFNFEHCAIYVRTAGHTDAAIGGLIAFETTNGFQRAKFDEIHLEFKRASVSCLGPAFAGCYLWAADPATDYATRNEAIEAHGHKLRDEVVHEAVANSDVITDQWFQLWWTEELWLRRLRNEADDSGTHTESDISDEEEPKVTDALLAEDYNLNHLEYYRQFCIKHFMAGYPDRDSYLAAREAAGGRHPPLNPAVAAV